MQAEETGGNPGINSRLSVENPWIILETVNKLKSVLFKRGIMILFVWNRHRYIDGFIFGVILLMLILAPVGNHFVWNGKLLSYYKAALEWFIVIFAFVNLWSFRAAYKNGLILTINFICCIFGFLSLAGSIAYLIYTRNLLAVPEVLFGSCGAAVGGTVQISGIEKELPLSKQMVQKAAECVNRERPKKRFAEIPRIFALLLIMAFLIGGFFAALHFLPDLFGTIQRFGSEINSST